MTASEPGPQYKQTQDHYDQFPYEVGVRESRIYRSTQTALGRFLAGIKGGTVLDLGCGPGNLLPVLMRKVDWVYGLDLSLRTLQMADKHVTGLAISNNYSLLQGNALHLPFGSQTFEVVLAVGILHHTPDAFTGFREICRVLKKGGSLFFSLYRRGGYYHYLYHTWGWIARRCERYPLTALLVNRCLFLPLFLIYFLVGRLIAHRRLEIPSMQVLINYFADQLLNPVVRFYTQDQVIEWVRQAGMEVESLTGAHFGALLMVAVRHME